MKQVIRRGLRQIIVDEVPDPVVIPHHVSVRPVYSLISSGTESAGIHQEALLKEVAGNPSHLQKIWNVAKVAGPISTMREVRAKLSEYAVLGYSGAGIVVDRHPTVSDLSIGDRVAYGGEGTGHGEAILAGRNLVARIPANVPFEHACFATLGAIAMNAVRIAGIGLGDRVAVIGMGLVGQLIGHLARWEHLPAIQKIPGVELNAVCSASGARGKSYGIRFGAAYCCSDYNQMLADPAIDAIFIVSRNQRHAAEAVAALEAGKHVFVEKPMALTEDECRTLVRAVERTARHLSVGFNRRFAP